MNGRFGAVLRAIGALTCSLALIMGVPLLLLATVGNPFPSSLPNFDEVETVLTQNGQGFSQFLLSVLALIVWFVWAQLIVAFAFELVFAARGRETPRLPTAPGVQSLAARLVTAMTLAATLAVAPLLAPAAGALHFEDPAVALPAATSANRSAATSAVIENPPTTLSSSVDESVDNLADLEQSITVSLGQDTELWDLSEAAYGDGVQWKLIAAANVGMRDAAGVLITNETEVVAAGTDLDVPGDPPASELMAFGTVLTAGTVLATSSDQVVELPSLEASTTVDVMQRIVPGDSMWSLAESEVADRLGREPSESEVAEYWFEVVQANDAISSGNPDLIYPGEMLTMPGRDAAAQAVEMDEVEVASAVVADTELPAEPSTAAGDAPAEHAEADQLADVARSSSASANDASEQPETKSPGANGPEVGAAAAGTVPVSPASGPANTLLSDPPLPAVEPGFPTRQFAIAAFGSALFASGVVAAIKRRRDLQRRLRAPGVSLPVASTEAAQLELALRHRSSQVIESTQGDNWRLLPAQAVIDLRPPSARELRVDPEHGTTIVESAEAEVSARSSQSPPVTSVALADIADLATITDIAEVAPGSLIVGTDPVSGDAVLLDLERASTVSLIGSSTDVRRFAQSAVLDLAVSDRAADLCVIAVGVAAGLQDLERVQCVESMAGALAAAVHCGHAPGDSSVSARQGFELATPLVVVATAEPIDDAEAVEALAELGAVVVGPGIDADVRITLNGDRAHIWPTGTTALVAALSADQFEAAAELVEVTSSDTADRMPAADELIAPPSPALVPAVDAPSAGRSPEPGPLEVQILGPVEVVGATSFSSVKAVDVLAYLAFHRNGVDADQIKTWVWPGFDPPTNKAFANVMSRARSGLGVDADGEPYLSKAGADKTYRLAPAVTTDFERFEGLVALADASDDQHFELEYLRQALDLIRGVPFTGGSVTSFAWADNYVRAHVEFSIDEAVHRCADLALSLDDLATARWAALKGLELVPGCEQCFRRRFLVAGAGSNRTELRRAMADLERITAAELGEPEAIDLISEDLLSLYHGLDRQLVAASIQETEL